MKQIYFYSFYILLLAFKYLKADLVIGVKTQKEIIIERFKSEPNENINELEFTSENGNYIRQVIDLNNNVEILKIYALGEIEIDEPLFQVACFVLYANKDDYISADSMSKLRQRNPTQSRVPDQNLGFFNSSMDLKFNLNMHKYEELSPKIREICFDAKNATYTTYQDILLWTNNTNKPMDQYFKTMTILDSSIENKCNKNLGLFNHLSCKCNILISIGWYPCDVKNCTKKYYNESDKKLTVSSYRCGIRTCKKTYNITFIVAQSKLCFQNS